MNKQPYSLAVLNRTAEACASRDHLGDICHLSSKVQEGAEMLEKCNGASCASTELAAEVARWLADEEKPVTGILNNIYVVGISLLTMSQTISVQCKTPPAPRMCTTGRHAEV